MNKLIFIIVLVQLSCVFKTIESGPFSNQFGPLAQAGQFGNAMSMGGMGMGFGMSGAQGGKSHALAQSRLGNFPIMGGMAPGSSSFLSGLTGGMGGLGGMGMSGMSNPMMMANGNPFSLLASLQQQQQIPQYSKGTRYQMDTPEEPLKVKNSKKSQQKDYDYDDDENEYYNAPEVKQQQKNSKQQQIVADKSVKTRIKAKENKLAAQSPTQVEQNIDELINTDIEQSEPVILHNQQYAQFSKKNNPYAQKRLKSAFDAAAAQVEQETEEEEVNYRKKLRETKRPNILKERKTVLSSKQILEPERLAEEEDGSAVAAVKPQERMVSLGARAKALSNEKRRNAQQLNFAYVKKDDKGGILVIQNFKNSNPPVEFSITQDQIDSLLT